MSIAEKGYTHWQGELKERKLPWWPITRQGIRLAFKRKYFKFSFFISLIPAVGFLIGIYISERIEDFQSMFKGSQTILKVNPAYFKTYFTSEFLLFMIVMIMVLAGAGLISDDLKYNSLQLYFARPLRKKDYFLGKASVIIFFISIITLVPGLVFFITKLLFSGSFKFLWEYPWLLLSILIYSFILTAFFAFYTLFISALSKNRRYVSILIFTVYLFSDILFGIFFGTFRNPYFALISIKCNLQQVGAALFKQKPPYAVPWYLSFLILCVISVFAGIFLQKKIREIEVIK
jgi:ABC-type transport system involved in multi-copper enzyme maturation permease subunit